MAKTLAEQIAAENTAHAERIAKLTEEARIREALAATAPWLSAYVEPRIYLSPLYGRVGLITFKAERTYSSEPPKVLPPDRELVDQLTRHFPARPVTKFKDGCLSFRTTAYVDALPDEKLERVDLTLVAPWLVKANPNSFSDVVGVHWFAEIAGAVWEIEVEFPRYSCQIGDWDIIQKHSPEGIVTRVDRCILRPVFPRAPEPPQVTRWASGSNQTLNEFTLWWYDNEPEVLEHVRLGILAALPEGKPQQEGGARG